MEDVLRVYTRPYDPRFPQLCMDEISKQLLKDKRPGLPARPGVGKGSGGNPVTTGELSRFSTSPKALLLLLV